MRLARELISAFVLLVIAYLVLEHYGGFSKDIASLGDVTGSLAKTFQGR
jgi:hypothetical protein